MGKLFGKKEAATTEVESEVEIDEVTLEDIRNDEHLYEAFYAYAETKMTEYHLDFLEATDRPYMHQINLIVATYIRAAADPFSDNKSINISYPTRTAVITAVTNMGRTKRGRNGAANVVPANNNGPVISTYQQAQGSLMMTPIRRGGTAAGVAEVVNAINIARSEVVNLLEGEHVSKFLETEEYKELKKSNKKKRRFRLFK